MAESLKHGAELRRAIAATSIAFLGALSLACGNADSRDALAAANQEGPGYTLTEDQVAAAAKSPDRLGGSDTTVTEKVDLAILAITQEYPELGGSSLGYTFNVDGTITVIVIKGTDGRELGQRLAQELGVTVKVQVESEGSRLSTLPEAVEDSARY